jgi:hypothetical protein
LKNGSIKKEKISNEKKVEKEKILKWEKNTIT